MQVLGEHAAPASPKLLMAEKHSEHPTAIADLHGRRLVVAQEVEQGHRLDESLVKQFTGGDALKARFMRQDFWSFLPTHTLWLATNHKPKIRGTDLGIWRRIRLIPFGVTIPEAERDKNLGANLVAELPGILDWAVQGCLDWQQNGLGTPPSVLEATDCYRLESDLIAQYIDECCLTGSGYQVRSSDLHGNSLKWCEDNGIRYTISNKALTKVLAEKGFHRTENRLKQVI